jgi:hypothetical protein
MCAWWATGPTPPPPGDVGTADIAFRANATGWTYWRKAFYSPYQPFLTSVANVRHPEAATIS